MTKQELLKYFNVGFEIDEVNAETERDAFGSMGTLLPLLPGLAENIIDEENGADVRLRRVVRDEDGWSIGTEFSIRVYFPGNFNQTCVVSVVKCTRECRSVDYYQMPYSEIAPRTRVFMQSHVDRDADSRWFVADVQNAQLEGWLKENGVMCLSKQALQLVEESETKHYENGGVVESQQKRADD